jgi:hypothetical protein
LNGTFLVLVCVNSLRKIGSCFIHIWEFGLLDSESATHTSTLD